jgi:hypothetical protein
MSNRYRNFVKYATIRVTNSETKAVYEHRRVPVEHVEMLKMNPVLKVEVLGVTEFRPKRDSVNEKTT